MILPTKVLWEQLDGPQANAVINAVSEYWKSLFDNILDYINNFNIDIAQNDHLTFLGILTNFVRPLVTVPDRDYFYLTEEVNHDDQRGLSGLDNRAVGGRLVGAEGARGAAQLINSTYYRALLKAYINNDAELNSLYLLDSICASLSSLDRPNVAPWYEFHFMEGSEIPAGRKPGDLYIDIGNMDQWANPMEVYSVLRGLAQSTYWPLPQVFISLDESVQIPLPTANLASGVYEGPQSITMDCSLDIAEIYYTLDGSRPTQQSTRYTGTPVVISGTCELRIKAFAQGYTSSDVAVYNYSIT